MEYSVDNQRKVESGGSRRRGEPDVRSAPGLHPALQFQQQAGNQAVQQLLRGGVIHAKLEISQPGDPEEQEADAMAARVMRSHAGPGATASCSCGEGEDEMCDECQEQTAVSRKASGSGRGGVPSAHKAINALMRSPGRGLDAATRAFFEPRFGRDFGDVRIHSDAAAAASARSIRALAYASGHHVVFDAGQYAPDTDQGRTLLAHELGHVVQGTDRVQRQDDGADDDGIRGPDPTDREWWSELHEGDSSLPSWKKDYEATLSGAPQASLDLEKDLKKASDPATDDDRDRMVSQIRDLIRMNALGLMASNRAHVENKRDELVNQPANADPQAKDQATAANAAAVRAAARTAVTLSEKREKFEDSARAFRLESGSQMRVGGDSFQEALDFMVDEAREYISPDIRRYFGVIAEGYKGQTRIDRGEATALIFNMGRYLADWRDKQAAGTTAALDQIYVQFPFFAQLSPEDVPQEWQASSQDLMEQVKDAYDDLLSKMDNAIVKIGAEDGIDPFDLPEAVKETRDSLSPSQQKLLDDAMEDRKAREFWIDMGLSFLQVAVMFIPVVGEVLAVGLGAALLAKGVDAALDRYQLASASTNPEGTVLGASGPSKFEWAMLAVQAALTAADVGGLAKELEAGRPHFEEAEPRLREEEPAPGEQLEGERTGTEREHQQGEGDLGGAPDSSPSAARLDAEATVLKERMQNPENIQDVLDENLAKDYDYQVSIESGGEKHTYYHRHDGGWCRASGVAFCGYSFGQEIEDALAEVRQARRPSASGKPTEKYVEEFLGPDFKTQQRSFEGKAIEKGPGKLGMSIADLTGKPGRRIVVEVKNIDIAANMRSGFIDLRGQVGKYMSNVPHPESTKFWLFMDIRGQKLPPGGMRAVVEAVHQSTGSVFDNMFFISELGVVAY